MKNMLHFIMIAFALLFFPQTNMAQAPNLGTTADFLLFSTNGAVTNSGISHLTGNVGTNNGSNTGFGNVNGTMNSQNGATAQAAQDLLIVYNQLNGTTATFFPSNLLGNGDTLNPGVYAIGSATILNGDLVLDANGNSAAVFIFKIQGAFSTNANAKVKLINGAKACNVFWKVEGLISFASGTTMRGTVIANNAAINMNAGDTLEGRAFSTTGVVIMNGTFAYIPIGCGSPTLTGPVAPDLVSNAGYALFSSNGNVSDMGTTHVNGGDIGTNSGTTTGFDSLLVTGMIHLNPDSSTARADTDLVNIYNYINLLHVDIELLYPAQFGNNLVLTPHTYLLDAATVLTDTLYLDAQGNPSGVFVIRINGALSTSVGSKIVLINGAQAQNVYWRVDGAAAINDLSVFNGTMLVTNGALNTGAVLNGRMLSRLGALTTNNATINVPGAVTPLSDLIVSTTTGVQGTYNNVTVTSTGNGTLTGNLMVMGNMIIQTGGKLNTGDNLVQGMHDFTLSTGASLTINSADGIMTTTEIGDIRVMGTRTYHAGATYIYAGNLRQTTGDGLPAAIDSLVINNINGVTLSASQIVNHKLTLGNGNLNIGMFNLTIQPLGAITNASANGYVATDDSAGIRGTLNRTVVSSGSSVLFPVGSALWKGSYSPATITMPSGTTDIISVRVFRGVMHTGATGAAVTSHVVNRSWMISEAIVGGSNTNVQLQWNDTMELPSFIRTKVGIAHHDGTSWNDPAAASYTAAVGSNPYTTTRTGVTSFSVFIVADSTTNNALPVRLLSFTGAKVNADVVLNWKTAMEVNNSHFEVERSIDGKIFEKVGTLAGSGNRSVLTNYGFTDVQVSGKSELVVYYKLMQVDFDGKITSYGPIAIQTKQVANDFNFTAFPNPIITDIQIQIMNNEVGTMDIAIYDIHGKIVAQKAAQIEVGMNRVTLDHLDALTGGVYFMHATLNGNIYTKKLIKNND